MALMGKREDGRYVFPLTSLQIGDLKSYHSDLSLFLALESNKFYVMVDNRPWMRDLGLRTMLLWQLMVTKSRLSPFAHSKRRKKGKEAFSKPSNTKNEKLGKWFSLIDASTLSNKKDLLAVKKLRSSFLWSSELHNTLYGFIVFEVSWSHVRGINYLNELQTDTSLALEAKLMLRWEFDSIAHAANSMTSWFSGTPSEQKQLKCYLDSIIGNFSGEDVFYDAEEYFSSSSLTHGEEIHCDDCSTEVCSPPGLCFGACHLSAECDFCNPHTPPPTGPYKRSKVLKEIDSGVEVDVYCQEMPNLFQENQDSSDNSEASEHESAVEATQYRDVLILFRFDDRDLPFKLRDIIMSDLRLLTLLEAGLPPWVLFLQSYPGFCHLYCPWMCPLARALYVIISVTTVIIGFYDLYKNVPMLKAMASRLCGPLFDWVETWEMASRIQYLGTMLFLHNFQKALRWSLAVTGTMRSFFSVLMQPLGGILVECFEFFLPLWNISRNVVESVFSVIWITVESFCTVAGDLMQVILLPVWFILSIIWRIVFLVLYPLLLIIWEVLYVPIRVVLAFSSFLAFLFASVYNLVGGLWQSLSSLFQLASTSRAAVSNVEVSMWRSLWNDLFSQVFRAVKSILYGFVAFFSACNRHRLSIYNHTQDLIRRVMRREQRVQTSDPDQSNLNLKSQISAEVRRRARAGSACYYTLMGDGS